MGETQRKYPFGFYVCAASFSFERFAFYASKWLLAVFIVAEVANGGLGLTKNDGATFNSYMVAFTYITPLIGGYIADRWVSPRLLVPLGEILMGLGYLCAWQASGKGMIWVMIVLISLGTGFFKGNLSGINGRLFDDPDVLDSAFSIQYSFVNIGSFLGTTIIGTLFAGGGYRTGFLICGIMLFVDVAWWLVGQKFLGDAGKRPFLVDNRNDSSSKAEASADDNHPLTTTEKKRVGAIILLTAFSIIFWMVWYLVYLPVYYEFGPVEQGGLGWASWNIGSFQIPTAYFDSMNALCCIVLGPVLAGVWAKLSKRPQGDMSIFKKTALGLILLASGIGVMVLGGFMSGEGAHPVNIILIVIVSVLMSLGEMVFSPLGNSFISKFSPKKLLGTLLGVWPLAIFFVGLVYGHLYNWLGNFNFVYAYGAVTVIVIICGVVLWGMSGKLDKLTEEE